MDTAPIMSVLYPSMWYTSHNYFEECPTCPYCPMVFVSPPIYDKDIKKLRKDLNEKGSVK